MSPAVGNTGYFPGMEWTVGVPAANRGCEMSKHTPGPWSVYNGLGKTIAVCIGREANGKRPCIVDWPGFDSCDLPLPQQVANANLIAAAPDLLKVVRELVGAIKDKSIQRSPAYSSDDIKWLDKRARAALAKAEAQP